MTALAFVVAGIAFFMWTYWAYSNAESLSTELEFSPGWAIGSWFIPILTLWRPYQIMSEIWRASMADP